MAATGTGDGFYLTAVSADVGPFTVLGGRYALMLSGTWGGGSATLQALMIDNTTYINVATAITADGATIVDLPPGSYKLDVATVTGLLGGLFRVPLGRGA